MNSQLSLISDWYGIRIKFSSGYLTSASQDEEVVNQLARTAQVGTALSVCGLRTASSDECRLGFVCLGPYPGGK